MVLGFFDVAVKWGNVLFFAFHAVGFRFGFFWRYVGKCDWTPAEQGFGVAVSFFLFDFGVVVFSLFILALY